MSIHVVNTNKAQLTTPASPPAIGSYTLAARVNLDTVSRDHILVVLASGTGNGVAQLQLDTGAGKLWALVEANDTNTQFSEASGTTVVAASGWYHVCGTYDGTTMRIYVNGVQEGTSTPTLVTPRAGNWATFQAPVSMDGSIQDVYACVGALSATQVLRLARARFPVDRPCQYWVPYNNGISSALNFSGIQGNLTITGSPTAGPEAGTPWGTQQQRPILRLLSNTLAVAATGSQLETGSATVTASKDASATGAQLNAGSVAITVAKAVAAAGAQLEAASVATSQSASIVATGNQLETASVAVTVAKAVAATGSQLETAQVTATGGASAITASGSQLNSGQVGVTGGGAVGIAATGAQLETGTVTMTKSAAVSGIGSQLNSGQVIITGGSVSPSGVRAISHNARRPLTILQRRGLRN